jgi:hypothetical protein
MPFLPAKPRGGMAANSVWSDGPKGLEALLKRASYPQAHGLEQWIMDKLEKHTGREYSNV